MPSDEARGIADELTGRVLALDGVRAVFPERPVLAAVLAAVTPGAGAPEGGVRVVIDEPVRVSARIAVAASTPSREVIAAIGAVVADAVRGPRSIEIEIEIAAID